MDAIGSMGVADSSRQINVFASSKVAELGKKRRKPLSRKLSSSMSCLDSIDHDQFSMPFSIDSEVKKIKPTKVNRLFAASVSQLNTDSSIETFRFSKDDWETPEAKQSKFPEESEIEPEQTDGFDLISLRNVLREKDRDTPGQDTLRAPQGTPERNEVTAGKKTRKTKRIKIRASDLGNLNSFDVGAKKVEGALEHLHHSIISDSSDENKRKVPKRNKEENRKKARPRSFSRGRALKDQHLIKGNNSSSKLSTRRARSQGRPSQGTKAEGSPGAKMSHAVTREHSHLSSQDRRGRRSRSRSIDRRPRQPLRAMHSSYGKLQSSPLRSRSTPRLTKEPGILNCVKPPSLVQTERARRSVSPTRSSRRCLRSNSLSPNRASKPTTSVLGNFGRATSTKRPTAQLVVADSDANGLSAEFLEQKLKMAGITREQYQKMIEVGLTVNPLRT